MHWENVGMGKKYNHSNFPKQQLAGRMIYQTVLFYIGQHFGQTHASKQQRISRTLKNLSCSWCRITFTNSTIDFTQVTGGRHLATKKVSTQNRVAANQRCDKHSSRPTLSIQLRIKPLKLEHFAVCKYSRLFSTG